MSTNTEWEVTLVRSGKAAVWLRTATVRVRADSGGKARDYVTRFLLHGPMGQMEVTAVALAPAVTCRWCQAEIRPQGPRPDWAAVGVPEYPVLYCPGRYLDPGIGAESLLLHSPKEVSDDAGHDTAG